MSYVESAKRDTVSCEPTRRAVPVLPPASSRRTGPIAPTGARSGPRSLFQVGTPKPFCVRSRSRASPRPGSRMSIMTAAIGDQCALIGRDHPPRSLEAGLSCGARTCRGT